MRGHYEESDEVKAIRSLTEAAREYCASFLRFQEVGTAHAALLAAAMAYAVTQMPMPRKKKRLAAARKRSGSR